LTYPERKSGLNYSSQDVVIFAIEVEKGDYGVIESFDEA